MPTSSRCSSYEFATDFRKIGLLCRVDVGIDPYEQIRKLSAENGHFFFDSRKNRLPKQPVFYVSAVQIIGADALGVVGGSGFVDAGQMALFDGDPAVYDGVIDRAADADGGEDRLGIIAGADQLQPAAVDQKQVAALAGLE